MLGAVGGGFSSDETRAVSDPNSQIAAVYPVDELATQPLDTVAPCLVHRLTLRLQS